MSESNYQAYQQRKGQPHPFSEARNQVLPSDVMTGPELVAKLRKEIPLWFHRASLADYRHRHPEDEDPSRTMSLVYADVLDHRLSERKRHALRKLMAKIALDVLASVHSPVVKVADPLLLLVKRRIAHASFDVRLWAAYYIEEGALEKKYAKVASSDDRIAAAAAALAAKEKARSERLDGDRADWMEADSSDDEFVDVLEELGDYDRDSQGPPPPPPQGPSSPPVFKEELAASYDISDDMVEVRQPMDIEFESTLDQRDKKQKQKEGTQVSKETETSTSAAAAVVTPTATAATAADDDNDNDNENLVVELVDWSAIDSGKLFGEHSYELLRQWQRNGLTLKELIRHAKTELGFRERYKGEITKAINEFLYANLSEPDRREMLVRKTHLFD